MIAHDTMHISFYSSGIADMLYPLKASNNTGYLQIVGVDVFRFLSQHAQGSLSREYKYTVKNSLRLGAAISLDLSLRTKRFMGFERFACHWTPLKDETGNVVFVVLTLGSASL